MSTNTLIIISTLMLATLIIVGVKSILECIKELIELLQVSTEKEQEFNEKLIKLIEDEQDNN